MTARNLRTTTPEQARIAELEREVKRLRSAFHDIHDANEKIIWGEDNEVREFRLTVLAIALTALAQQEKG